MNFCSNCGAPAGGGAYCANCGQSLSAGSATQTGGSAGGQQTVSPQTHDAATPASRVRAANPFSDIPIIDYVRDAAALVLLLVSFGMPWDLADSSTGKVYVILAALLSIASLTLPYLKRGGILPTTWGTAQLRLARLAANAPYVVVVLVTVVLAYVGENGGDGVGVGVAFGLAGAILAAQGRQTELEPAPGDGALWRSITLGVAGLFALISVLSLVMFMVDFASDLEWAPITLQILIIVFFLAVPALPLLSFVRGQHGGRDALMLVAVVGLFVGLWQMSADATIGDVWSLRASTPGILLFPALGAAAAAAGVAARTKANGGSTRWIGLATHLFYVTLLVGAFGAVTTAVQLVDADQGRGAAITVVVLYLLVVVAALVGRNALVSDPNQGRAVALGAALVFAVLGVVIVSVLGASDLYVVGLADATMVSVMWWFAIAILLALTTPKAVRDELGPVSASTVGLGNGGAAKTEPSAGAQTPAATTTSAPTEGNATPTAHPTPSQATGQTPGVKAPGATTPEDESARTAASDTKAQDTKASGANAEEAKAPETKAADAKPAESKAAEARESTSGAAAAAGAAGAAGAVSGAAVSGVGTGQESSDETRSRDTETSSTDESPYRRSGADAEKTGTEQARTQAGGTGGDTSGARSDEAGASTPEPADSTAVLPQTDAGEPSATESASAGDTSGPRVVREAGFDSKTAANPDTPLQTLADIAAQAPSLRPYLAANPSTYPELVEWLRHLGDPAVDEALRRRDA